MHIEEIRRFITTDDYVEFIKWEGYMKMNNIDHRTLCKFVGGNYICKIEIIGKDDDEIEQIKKNIGFYFDED